MKNNQRHSVGTARRRILRRVTLVLGAIAIFVTTYALILPAITMEARPFCGLQEHVHEDGCYQQVPVCGYEEGDPVYTEISRQELICGNQDPDHIHDESCCETVTERRELGFHTHTEDCFESILICGMPEHTHTLQCFSDPAADTDENGWVQRADRVLAKLRPDRSDHSALLAVAMSQTGYRESENNYQVLEDGVSVRGYTVYGAAEGQPYGAWDGAFVSWCVRRAGISMPTAPTTEMWLLSLRDAARLVSPDCIPAPGDLVFLRSSENDPIRMGILSGVETRDGLLTALEAVTGDDGGAVTTLRLSREELGRVFGFGLVPEPETALEAPAPETSESETAPTAESETAPAAAPETAPAAEPEIDITWFQQSLEDVTVTVAASADAFPEGTEMHLTEVDTRHYAETVAELVEAPLDTLRAVDISFHSQGAEVEPLRPVKVWMTTDAAEALVVHVDDRGDAEVLESETAEGYVSFQTESFSVYAIVEAPEPETVEVQQVLDAAELVDNTPFYLYYNGNRYFTSDLNNNSCLIESVSRSAAARWYFEPTGNGTYRLYTYLDGAKKYLKNTSGNLVGLVDSGGTPLEITRAADGKFYFKISGQNKWLQHSNGGGGIRFYTDNTNATNSRISMTYADSYELPKDPYGLDGRTCGLVYNNDSATAAGLTATARTVSGKAGLAGQDMIIRPNVLSNDGILLVSENTDLAMWTFTSVESDRYYLTTTVDGAVKYLTINGGAVTLEDAPDPEKSLITVTPGTGDNAGKLNFTVNGYSLRLFGNAAGGFGGSTSTDDLIWLNMAEKSVLSDDDFNLYTARKVSVSDTEEVATGKQVVIYTRIWNDDTKRYEFYAVDHDGSLVRCYDTGNNIEWIGSQVNTALWEFTEYTNTDGTPNYYYELENVQYHSYIAPQITGGQVLSDHTLGINLNGRRYGENYSTIIAWDDRNYAYVGLKTENGRVVACPLSEAEDFYFAVVDTPQEEDQLSTVRTIDNNEFGITMKMVDFNNPLVNNRDSVQNGFFGGVENNVPGLLSTDHNE